MCVSKRERKIAWLMSVILLKYKLHECKASLYQGNTALRLKTQILESICMGIPILSLASYGTLGKFLDYLWFQMVSSATKWDCCKIRIVRRLYEMCGGFIICLQILQHFSLHDMQLKFSSPEYGQLNDFQIEYDKVVVTLRLAQKRHCGSGSFV